MTDPDHEYQKVRRLHELTLTPGTGRVAWATDPALHPDGHTVAVTGTIAESLDDVSTRICLIRGDAGAVEVVPDELGSHHGPCWSPDGRLIAYMSDQNGGLARATIRRAQTLEPLTPPHIPGAVETIAFSPDSGRLLLAAAEPLADVGDTQLSADARAPQVRSTDPTGRRRNLWLHDIDRDQTQQVALGGRSVWDAGWVGDGSIALLASTGWSEGDWFHAKLVVYDLLNRSLHELPTAGPQLAHPRGDPSGTRIAVIEALASDRGNVAGRIRVIDIATGHASHPDLPDVDVTDVFWLDGETLAWIGIRGQEVLAGRVNPGDERPVEVIWSDEASCGRHMPTASFSPNRSMAIIEDNYTAPPAILRFDPRGRALAPVSLAPPALDELVDLGGRAETVSWLAPDGTVIHGTLCRPQSPAPYPLIVHIHGGPIDVTTNAWHMQNDSTRALVGAGYAVLHPNPRGSIGRGAKFREPVLHDIGGADTFDLLSGVDAMVTKGLADPDRLGVAGTSYGGFMAAWLPAHTDRFRAAVAISPVTDWASLYYTSNIARFVEMFLGGTPTDIPLEYLRRSPMTFAAQNHTPTLLMAGGRDLCTPAEQAARLHGALALSGIPTELVIYPDDGHGARTVATQIDQAARALGWFDRYLRPERCP